ncbi:MAG: GNAT family protein [Pseudomonadota bacterium]
MKLADWTPRPRPAPDILQGAHARLERLDWTAHGAELFEAVAEPGIWTYMPDGPFPERASFEAEFEATRAANGWETLIVRAADGPVLGMASYMRIREAHGSVEVGCVAFGPRLKRTRVATDAMYLMARHIFEDLGYRRYEWKCNNANIASRRAALRFGFRFEGVFRNDMVVKGANRDTAWYAMTDADWRVVRAAFEAWLSPTNFDADGRQLASLSDFRSEVA